MLERYFLCFVGLAKAHDPDAPPIDPKSCVLGTYFDEAGKYCVPCPVGFYCKKGMQLKCEPGTMPIQQGNAGSCVECADNLYSPTGDKCQKCPIGLFPNKTNDACY